MEEEKEVVVKPKNRHADTSKKSGRAKKIIIAVILLIFIIVILGILWYNISLSGTGTSEEEVSIEIPMGSGTNKIADILKENNLIKSEVAFKLYVKLNNVSSFQAGKYTITKDMKVSDIVEALQSGKLFKESNLKITFVEGKNFRYIAS